ncbi:MAG: glycosyltransferase family 2 protein [Pirellulales bacterium]|nr:glycosyltransferase family 2 protein [Pirellulales bacterium]
MSAADVRPTITAAIITLDEERNLQALLPRLDWVDEVLVIDGGSSDATRAVARRYGCRVVERRFDSFARQRNHAISRASCDWILSLDADETPSPRLVTEIIEHIRSHRCDAYRLPIRSTILGKPLRRSGTQDDRPVRLFRAGSARWVGDVHERLEVNGRVGTLRNWLMHGTQATLDVFLCKMNRYTTLEARSRVAAGLPPGRFDPWLFPPREIFRRLIYKQGILDGPAGWKFCLLSGLYEWVLADRHRRYWQNIQHERFQ